MNLAAELEAAVARGVALLDGDACTRIATYLRSRISAEGLFRGNADDGDLYYTAFGLSAWLALGKDLPAPVVTALAGADGRELDDVHRASLAWSRRLMTGLPAGRPSLSPRLKAAQRTGSAAIGVYDAFLGMASLGVAELNAIERMALRRVVKRCRCDGGGYAREAGGGAASTPATAAAVVLQSVLAREDPAAREWLSARRVGGGYAAGVSVGQPDLLSTAVTLFALRVAGHVPSREEVVAGVEFVHACWSEEGGFLPMPGIGVADVEYTWYGLLALGAV